MLPAMAQQDPFGAPSRTAPADGETLMMDLWPVLESCANGRTDGHHCPYCVTAVLDCEVDEGWVRITCTGCGMNVEAGLNG
jgi:hypothetical protein